MWLDGRLLEATITSSGAPPAILLFHFTLTRALVDPHGCYTHAYQVVAVASISVQEMVRAGFEPRSCYVSFQWRIYFFSMVGAYFQVSMFAASSRRATGLSAVCVCVSLTRVWQCAV